MIIIRRCHHRTEECYCVRNDELLYAVAHMYLTHDDLRLPPHRREWKGDFTYVHARDAGEAYTLFMQCEWDEKPRLSKIVVAPVIGYFVDDNQGRQLSV